MAEEETPKEAEDKPYDQEADEAEEKTEESSEDPNWKAESRKHESRAKRLEAKANKLELRLKEIEDEGRSEQEKAIEKARNEALGEAKVESEKARKADRLEVAITRAAAKGVQVGEGEKAKTVRFDDPEDALVFVERQIATGDLDADSIFNDEGKVRADALGEVLSDLLTKKPRLAAGQPEGGRPGDADAGKGKPDAAKMSVDEHLADLQKRK